MADLIIWHGWKVYSDNVPQPLPGIYKITNVGNDKIYVGESSNIFVRLSDYVFGSRYLKEDLKIYGKSSFIVEPIKYFDETDTQVQRLLDEEFHISRCNSLYPYGYNIQRASGLGVKRGDHFSSLVSEGVTKLWENDEYRVEVMLARQSPEVRARTNEALKAAWARGHDARVAMMQTPEFSKKLSDAQYARYKRPGELDRVSVTQKKLWADPIEREKRVSGMTAFANSDEGRKVKSLATKGTIWINNGSNNKRVLNGTTLPEGYTSGKLPHSKTY